MIYLKKLLVKFVICSCVTNNRDKTENVVRIMETEEINDMDRLETDRDINPFNLGHPRPENVKREALNFFLYENREYLNLLAFNIKDFKLLLSDSYDILLANINIKLKLLYSEFKILQAKYKYYHIDSIFRKSFETFSHFEMVLLNQYQLVSNRKKLFFDESVTFEDDIENYLIDKSDCTKKEFEEIIQSIFNWVSEFHDFSFEQYGILSDHYDQLDKIIDKFLESLIEIFTFSSRKVNR